MLENPTNCTFDPKVVLCKGAGNDAGTDCLTAPQVEAARKIYAGASHARTHEPLYPGLAARAAKLGWNQSVAARPVGYAEDFFKYIVFKDPEKWEPKHLNYDSDVAMTDKTATGLNAVDADLTQVCRARRQAASLSWLERSRASRRRTR